MSRFELTYPWHMIHTSHWVDEARAYFEEEFGIEPGKPIPLWELMEWAWACKEELEQARECLRLHRFNDEAKRAERKEQHQPLR